MQISLGLFCFEFTLFLDHKIYVFSQIWDVFSQSLFQYFFFFNFTLFFLSFWNSNGTNIRSFINVPQDSEAMLIYFLSNFSPLFRSGNPIVLSSNPLVLSSLPFILLLCLSIEFYICYCIFSYEILIWFFFIFLLYCLAETVFFYSFHVAHNCSAKHSHHGCF